MDQFKVDIKLVGARAQCLTKIFNSPATAEMINELIASEWNLSPEHFYILQNGRNLSESCMVVACNLTVVPRVLGGKGGFGSMLRAIGAQIEKTTNRDACRDLSGRRLRDINEEQRLKKWFEGQEEREQEREEQRQKKLEKLRKLQEGPELPKMDDPEYFKQREQIEDAVYAAVDAGFQAAKPKISSTASAAAGSASCEEDSQDLQASVSDEERSKSLADQPGPSKRAAAEPVPQPKKKLKKLMLDEDLDSDSSDDSDEETTAVARKN